MARNKFDSREITVLRMKNGKEHIVISEDGKYYHCSAASFRKSNPDIESVMKRTTPEKITGNIEENPVNEVE